MSESHNCVENFGDDNMEYIYDKRFGISCKPACAEEWMEYIFDVGCGYDGCNTVE